MMSLIRTFVPITMLLAATAAQAGDAGKGQDLARSACARCHLIGPGETSGADTAPPFRDVAKNPAWQDVARLMAHLADPHPAMPGFSMSRAEASNLVAYLATLRE
ncbi:MAG: c-type cytochrome [Labrys sp. (in: a-proteobacteria)]|jgi:cytochrome c